MKKKRSLTSILAIVCAVTMVLSMFPAGSVFNGITYAADETTSSSDEQKTVNDTADEDNQSSKEENSDKESGNTKPEDQGSDQISPDQSSDDTSSGSASEKKDEMTETQKDDEEKKDEKSAGSKEEKTKTESADDSKKEEEKGFKVEFDFGENYGRMNPINPKETDANGKIRLPEKPKARDEVFKAEDGKEYYFTGWEYKDKEYGPGDYVTVKADAKFIAVWKQTYTIKFSAKGIEADKVEEQVEVYGEPVVLPEEKSSDSNLDFIGWTPDDGETIYEAGVKLSAGIIQPSSHKASAALVKLRGVNGDETAPVVEIALVNAQNSTWKITASDSGSGVDKVLYFVSDTDYSESQEYDWRSDLTNTATDEGAFEATIDVEEGKYLFVKATDKSENESAVETIKADNLETEAPSIELKSGDDATKYAKTHTFEYSVEDNPKEGASGIRSITAYLKDSSGDTVEEITLEDESGEFTVPTTNVDLSGIYSVVLKAVDKNGNKGEPKTVSNVALDNVAPTVTSLEMRDNANEGYYYYNKDNAKIYITANDTSSEISSVTVVAGSVEIAAANNEGVWVADADVEGLSDGTISFSIKTKDAADNENTACLLPATVSGLTRSGDTTAEFVLDRTAPALTSVVTAPSASADQKYGNDTDGYNYYYNDKDVVTTYTIDEDNPGDLVLSYSQDGNKKTGTVSDDKKSVTGYWGDGISAGSTSTTISGIILTASDMAGNKLVLADDYDTQTESEDKVSSVSEESGVQFSYGKVIDTEAPTVLVTYKASKDPVNLADVYIYDDDNNNKKTAYVSGFVTVEFTVIDNRPLKESDIQFLTADPETYQSVNTIVNDSDKSFSIAGNDAIAFTSDVDGPYQYSIFGTDRSGKPIKVIENLYIDNNLIYNGEPWSGDKPWDNETAAASSKDAAAQGMMTFVRDTTAPVYTSSFDSVADPDENVVYDDTTKIYTAYYGKAYEEDGLTGTFVITDANLNLDRSGAYKISLTGDKYSNLHPAWPDTKETVKPTVDTEKNTTTYTVNTKDQGVHRFYVYGVDKAGNKLEKGEDEDIEDITENTQKTYNQTVSHGEGTGEFWSMEKVLDTVSPKATVIVGDSADFFRMTMQDKVHNCDTYDPFQKDKYKADIKITQEDKSPVTISYKVPWKKPKTEGTENGHNGNDENKIIYQDGAHSEMQMTAVKGEGVQFSVDDIEIKDRAGNTTKYDGAGWIIYLDNAQPKPEDNPDVVKPFVSIKAISENTHSYVDNKGERTIYNKSVTLQFTVTDPYESRSSSGLHLVEYNIKVDGHDLDKDKLIKGGILLNRDKESDKDYARNNTIKTDDEDGMQFTFKETIPIKSYKESKDDTFESNKIEVTLAAHDNAGNHDEAYLDFGIDSVGPKVYLSFDNNSAQHGKYFKDTRVATIKVVDRNLGENSQKIKIKTQTNPSKSWKYGKGSDKSGNDDTWTKKAVYSKDGDYTLKISGTDALNNPIEGGIILADGTVAPWDFVIDKTPPVLNVTFDNKSVRNGKYYKANRTATVSIKEHNFNLKGKKPEVDLKGQAKTLRKANQAFPAMSSFSSSGDNRTATIPFTKEGIFSFTVEYTDLAGNKAVPKDPYKVDEFVIDKTAPIVKIENVVNNGIYGGTVAPKAIFEDDTFSREDSQFKFTGIRVTDRSALVPAFQYNGEYGGSYVMSDFPNLRINDDIYTAYAASTDMAGNTTTTQVTFSVNRFGSTYDYNNDDTTIGLVSKESGRYYTNEATPLQIREINVNDIKKYDLTLDRGGNSVKLKEGDDYNVVKNHSDRGSTYIYKISKDIVSDEGSYSIVVRSEDEAGNINTNAAIRSEKESVEVPLRFVYDVTAPVMSFLDTKDGDKIIELKTDGSNLFRGIRELDLGIVPDDDWAPSAIQYVLTGRDGVIRDSERIEGKEFWDIMGEDGIKRFDQDIQSGTDLKKLEVTVWDAAGNETTQTFKILVTHNFFELAVHYWYIVLAVLAAIAAIIIALLKSRNKNSKESEDLQGQNLTVA